MKDMRSLITASLVFAGLVAVGICATWTRSSVVHHRAPKPTTDEKIDPGTRPRSSRVRAPSGVCAPGVVGAGGRTGAPLGPLAENAGHCSIRVPAHRALSRVKLPVWGQFVDSRRVRSPPDWSPGAQPEAPLLSRDRDIVQAPALRITVHCRCSDRHQCPASSEHTSECGSAAIRAQKASGIGSYARTRFWSLTCAIVPPQYPDRPIERRPSAPPQPHEQTKEA